MNDSTEVERELYTHYKQGTLVHVKLQGRLGHQGVKLETSGLLSDWNRETLTYKLLCENDKFKVITAFGDAPGWKVLEVTPLGKYPILLDGFLPVIPGALIPNGRWVDLLVRDQVVVGKVVMVGNRYWLVTRGGWKRSLDENSSIRGSRILPHSHNIDCQPESDPPISKHAMLSLKETLDSLREKEAPMTTEAASIDEKRPGREMTLREESQLLASPTRQPSINEKLYRHYKAGSLVHVKLADGNGIGFIHRDGLLTSIKGTYRGSNQYEIAFINLMDKDDIVLHDAHIETVGSQTLARWRVVEASNAFCYDSLLGTKKTLNSYCNTMVEMMAKGGDTTLVGKLLVNVLGEYTLRCRNHTLTIEPGQWLLRPSCFTSHQALATTEPSSGGPTPEALPNPGPVSEPCGACKGKGTITEVDALEEPFSSLCKACFSKPRATQAKWAAEPVGKPYMGLGPPDVLVECQNWLATNTRGIDLSQPGTIIPSCRFKSFLLPEGRTSVHGHHHKGQDGKSFAFAIRELSHEQAVAQLMDMWNEMPKDQMDPEDDLKIKNLLETKNPCGEVSIGVQYLDLTK